MFSLLLYLFSSLICVLGAQTIPKQKEIYDFIHSKFYIKNSYISDILVFFQMLIFIYSITIDKLDKLFLTLGYNQILKLICSLSTVLPPLKTYEEKFRFGGLNGSGTEYIYSGHASYSALSFLYLYENKILPLEFLIFYNLISQFCIIASKNHYTIDVILAWIIVPLLYYSEFVNLKS